VRPYAGGNGAARAGIGGNRAGSRPVPGGLGGREWTAIPTRHKVVALTFDAEANADGVSSILATLAREHVPATFFLTGNFTGSFPAEAKAIVAAGERVGDHSVSHPHFTRLTDAQMRDQVLRAEAKIISVTGADSWPWFRFPFGDRNAHTISVVNSVGFVPVGWTVDTLGWNGTSGGITVQTVVNRVLANLRPGEIVLMHSGSGGVKPGDHSTLDADALPAVIKDLRARGYSFVTIDALRGIGYLVLTSKAGCTISAPAGTAPWPGNSPPG
jgi:peptidoglycan/xylan/chitin deacetylase (PgdA/CDA1 family)